MKKIKIEMTIPYTDEIAEELKDCAVYANTPVSAETTEWMENVVTSLRAQTLAAFATPPEYGVHIDRNAHQ